MRAECQDSLSGFMEWVSTDTVAYWSREGDSHWRVSMDDGKRGLCSYRLTLTEALGQALFKALIWIN